MARSVRFRGVERHEEVDVLARRDDARSLRRRFLDGTSTPEGTVRLFAWLAGAAFASSFIPFVPELLAAGACVIYLRAYNYKKRFWEMPYRVPAYLGRKGYRDKSTGELGAATVYLGAARDSRTSKFTEVWGDAGDIKTHRLVVGTTGSGKTEEMLGGVFNMLMQGSGAMFVDGKAAHGTWDSFYRLARLFGRDEEIFLTSYILGGKDVFGATETKLSNTFNPFAIGSSSMKAELMNDMMPSGKADVWSERANSFNAALMTVLEFLASRGYVMFSPRLLVDYYSLERLENLIWFALVARHDGATIDLRKEAPEDWKLLDSDRVSGPIKLYITQLPGYSMAKPAAPHDLSVSHDRARTEAAMAGPDAVREWANTNGKGGDKEKPKTNDQARARVSEQHGFITMQLVRATSLLAFEYGHIFNNEVGEIDPRDMMINRRLAYTALPSLEKSPASMAALGKLTVSSVKGVLATMLDAPFEGIRRVIIDGRPSNAKVPFGINLDEYGYYIVPGFAVAPAQSRSFNVSLTFGAQDYASLKKGDENEAQQTFENTNLRLIGRYTGGKESETFQKFSGAAGTAHVSAAMEMTFTRGKIGGPFEISKSSRAEETSRIAYEDLGQQENGEFTLIVGSKTDVGSSGRMMAREGGIRVIRYLALYTGPVPALPLFRLNHFVAVRPPRPETLRAVAEAERARLKLQNAHQEDVLAWLAEPPQQEFREALRDSALTHLVVALKQVPEGTSEADIARIGLETLSQFVRERMAAVIDSRIAQELAPIERELRADIDAADLDEEDQAAIAGVLVELLEEIRRRRMIELTGQKRAVHRVDLARSLLNVAA